MLHSPIGRVRLVALAEGISYVVLLGIAMPLKYLADLPLAVRIVGSLHGLLFVALCGALLHAVLVTPFPMRRAVVVFVASLLPFGAFVIDPGLKRDADGARPT